MDRIKRASLLAFLVASIAFLSFNQSFAQNSDDGTPAAGATPDSTIWFVIAPEGKHNGDYFDVTLSPGESISLSGRFGNGSEIPVQAVLYAANAIPNTNGGFALGSFDLPKSEPTTWLDFPTETVGFEANSAVDRSFTVSVPDGTAPGQYLTGVAIETAESSVAPGGSLIQVKYRLAAPVLITVPGEVRAGFNVSGLSVNVDEFSTTVTGTISNTGNVRVRPAGSVILMNDSGDEVVNIQLEMRSVYAGQTTLFSQTLQAPIPEGTYSGSVILSDADTGANSSLQTDEIVVKANEAPSPISISDASILGMPTTDNLVFAQISVTIANTSQPVQGAQLTLIVYRDGEEVDRAVLGTSMALQQGDTTIEQIYIPSTGSWESGIYSFELTLVATDPQTSNEVVLDTLVPDASLEVP